METKTFITRLKLLGKIHQINYFSIFSGVKCEPIWNFLLVTADIMNCHVTGFCKSVIEKF
jgi:hypothetical protein